MSLCSLCLCGSFSSSPAAEPGAWATYRGNPQRTGNTDGKPGPEPLFLQFPADPLLVGRRVLIVDEVWDSGTTIHAVAERVRRAGGVPTTAVLHYKPERSKVPEVPDHHVVTTDRWVVYPFKGGA